MAKYLRKNIWPSGHTVGKANVLPTKIFWQIESGNRCESGKKLATQKWPFWGRNLFLNKHSTWSGTGGPSYKR